MFVRFTAFLSLLTLFAIAWPTSLAAQIYDPVTWSFSVDVHDDEGATLVLQADIQKGWHVYATELPSDDGPIATSFEFESSGAYALDGKIQEPKYITKFDPNFDMELNFHDNQAIFRQKVKLLSPEALTIKGMLTFMTCDDEKCLPPEDVDFSFDIPARESSAQGLAIPGSQPPADGILEPVKWDFSIEDEGNNNYVFVDRKSVV